jgi:flavin reductase (DIM6/NTAB) family NADH-FMN oxidoreductase RutF
MERELRLIADSAPGLASGAEFRAAMTALASGVVLVTCRFGDRPWGTTVTSFASVSADPPTVLVSLRSESAGARAIAATRRFGVSILAEEQLLVARHGSAPGASKFLERFVEAGAAHAESPVVAGALAHLHCELSREVQVADHTVFFGCVRLARASDAGTPLLYHRRDYRTLAEQHPTERSTTWLAN